jgi:tRNA pseudouridine38-40 synthase
MARYQVILAYDGTAYLGFQRLGRGKSVQGEVEAALTRLGWQGEKILLAGRTDRGVHAAGQVIAFDLEWPHPVEALRQAVNAHLPADIAARQVHLAPDRFHPRYWAQARRYQYHLVCDEVRDPLRERYAWRIWPAVSLECLQQAADLIPGRRDFSAFGAPQKRGANTIREVVQASWTAQGEGVVFEITANAFLYHMVRRLVYLQVLVGQGRWGLDDFHRGLEENQPQAPGLAPAQGLCLVEVVYPAFEREDDLSIYAGNLQAASGEDDRGQDLRP